MAFEFPFISIIMPAFNADRYISTSIQSVIDQTFQNWELIIIDDGSTDDTANIVKAVQDKDERIIYFYQQNKRLGAARNSGFRLAKGKWIAFLDSDDLWDPAKLAVQMDFIEKNKVDVVYTDGYMLMEQTQQLIPYPTITGWYAGSEMYNILFEQNTIPILSVLMNRSWIDKVGYQDESLSIFGCEDLDYWLRIAKNNGIFYGMPEKLFHYRVHHQAMSRNNVSMKLAESTALYKNIDRHLNTGFLRKRFTRLCVPIIPELIKLKRKDEAIKQVEILLSFSKRINYKLLFHYLGREEKLNLKIIHLLLEPFCFLRPIKKAIKLLITK
jgi:teichuronic acid biosynthesis glycosyltransferase TuaG